MGQQSRIFMLGDENNFCAGRRLLEDNGYDVFATDNAYLFVSYAGELHPQLFVLDGQAKGTDCAEVLDYLWQNGYLEEAPGVVINGGLKPVKAGEAAHYLFAGEKAEKLLVIANAYCRGKEKYRLLIVENFPPCSAKSFAGQNMFPASCFQVDNVSGAKVFLRHNKPQAVAVHCRREEFEPICRQMGLSTAYFVENQEKLEKILSFDRQSVL